MTMYHSTTCDGAVNPALWQELRNWESPRVAPFLLLPGKKVYTYTPGNEYTYIPGNEYTYTPGNESIYLQ